MSVVWSLEYNGDKRPLKQWGITSAQLRMENQAGDTLTIRVADEPANDATRFAFMGRVVLWRDAVRWFHGVVTQLPFEGSAQADRQDYVISGPWWYLENIVYQQPAWVLRDPNQPNLGYASINVSNAVLFQSNTGGKQDAGAMAQDVVDYAIFKAGLFYGGTAPFARGSFADLVSDAPWEKGLDLSCAEALKRCGRWTRDAVTYWDYTPAVPVLHFRRRANLTIALIDLADGDLVGEFSVTPREDLVPRGVLLRFQKTITQATTGAQWTAYEDQTAGVTDGGLRVITATLVLAGSGAGAEPVPNALATAFFNSLSTLPYEGSIKLREAECTGLLRPGTVLNLDGGKAIWETMEALIQRIEEDLLAGTTRAEFGPADQLGPQDFIDLVRTQRGGAAGAGAGGRMDGTPETPKAPKENPPTPPSGPPAPNVQKGQILKVCENGTEKEIFVPSL